VRVEEESAAEVGMGDEKARLRNRFLRGLEVMGNLRYGLR
jgi:hypothetical protein